MYQIYSATCILIVYSALIDTGYALNCWNCDTQLGGGDSCADHFNISQILKESESYLEKYDYGFPKTNFCYEDGTKNEKTVCLKLVFKDVRFNNKQRVQRECKAVSKDFKAGGCPSDLTADSSRTIDFCGTCEIDGCNSATAIKTSLITAIVPVMLLLLIQK